MLIVSDTGPLRYLIEIDAIEALPALYGSVLTTPVVLDELSGDLFPPKVRQWVRQTPAWLVVEPPQKVDFLQELDEGEASALSLAVEKGADAVLIDERDGTQVARSRGLQTVGTLAVLVEAGRRRLLDFHSAIHRLTHETSFHHSPKLIAEVTAMYERSTGH